MILRSLAKNDTVTKYRECPPTPRMRSTGIFDRLLVVLMSLNTFYLDGTDFKKLEDDKEDYFVIIYIVCE